MPELPEVETVRKSLENYIVNREVKKINVLYKPILVNSTPINLANKLIGKKFSKVDRIGKFLLLRIGEYTLISHLRMEGKYYFGRYKGTLLNKKELVEVDLNSEMIDQFHKHIHLIIEFEDQSLLIYHDTRKFGKFHLFKTGDELNHAPLKSLGNEPFTLKPKTLHQNLSKRTIPIKQALLAQDLIAGLGNIYVDETLFLSGLSPFLPANKVSLTDAEKIIKSAINVLNKAINMGGSTIRSYHVDNEVSGKFQNELYVYGKDGQPCKKCKTQIVKTFINGRGTHFCPQCQSLKLSGKNRIIGVTGIMHSGKSTVAELLKSYGYEAINADQLAKEAYTNKQIIKLVTNLFGAEILKKNQINFSTLRTKATTSKDGLVKLEKIVHPYVIAKTKEVLASNPNKKFVLDIPLLFESGMDKLCDKIIFVNINENAWKLRLAKFSKIPLKEAKAMRSRLLPNELKIKNSQIILENSGNLSDLKRQISHFSSFLKQ